VAFSPIIIISLYLFTGVSLTVALTVYPMTSTICTTLEPSFSHVMDYPRNSNMAGCPLPSIPRRTSSSRHSQTHSTSEPTLALITGATRPATLVVHPPTPPPGIAFVSTISPQPDEAARFSESDSSSSSTSSDGSQPTIILRPKRIRGQRSPPRIAAEQYSLPPPATRSKQASSKREPPALGWAVKPLSIQGEASNDVTPNSLPSTREIQELSSKVAKLGINYETVPTRHVSESHVDTLIESQFLPIPPATVSTLLPSEARLLRKKSGEPIKSSLKSLKRPGLSVIIKSSSSKSEPNTPTQSKAVHFDAQLEHVKLFLAEQKPLAVSRDGSPTDTSGTDNEFPEFIYGHSSDEEKTRKNLVMQVTNMPKKRKIGADVALQELTLSSDSTSIYGRVKVKNIAFEKWLAVRFTFDWWQTTSEVTAKYVESIEDNNFDIFGFTIRLNDIMARIEEKALFLALRYTVAGREIWDNNGGENYLARFTKSQAQPQKRMSKEEDVSSGGAITHLKSRLEQVAQGRDSGASFLAHRVHRQARLEAQKPPVLQVDKSLSARYDFSASLKDNSWKTVSHTPPHIRANTYPSTSNTIPWPQKPSPELRKKFDLPPRSPRTSALGSPGLDDVVARVPTIVDSNLDDAPFGLPPTRRHHQRGYFERSMSEATGVKRTPPGTPGILSPSPSSASMPLTPPSQLSRFHSFPPRDGSRKSPPYNPVATFVPSWPAAQYVPTGGSDDSTPSISSPSGSSATSPSLSPTDEFKHTMTDRECSQASPSGYNGHDNYSSFLNRCDYFLF
jgi:Carbohydrate/starch-binding module (family 21)